MNFACATRRWAQCNAALRDWLRGRGEAAEEDQAAFLRLASSRASTRVTVSFTASDRMPFCAAMDCTRRSTRSMLAAPPKSARAAEDGLPSDSAALAYFSNGTRSF